MTKQEEERAFLDDLLAVLPLIEDEISEQFMRLLLKKVHGIELPKRTIQ